MNKKDAHALGILGGFATGLLWVGVVTAGVDIRILKFLSFFFIPLLVVYLFFLFNDNRR